MKYQVFLISISFLACALPVQANPKPCLERELSKESMAPFNFSDATQVASVTHEGKTYDWIMLSESSGRFKDIPSVIVTDSNNYCEMPVFDPGGNLTSAEQYQDLLGNEVYAKFLKAFKENR